MNLGKGVFFLFFCTWMRLSIVSTGEVSISPSEGKAEGNREEKFIGKGGNDKLSNASLQDIALETFKTKKIHQHD